MSDTLEVPDGAAALVIHADGAMRMALPAQDEDQPVEGPALVVAAFALVYSAATEGRKDAQAILNQAMDWLREQARK